MNGTPFSAAWNAACSAGQVASFMLIVPAMIAAVKRGARPNSPRLTAEVSSVSTQPAPISMSACRLEVGSATSVEPLDAAPDQRARRRHGDAGAFARHRQHAAIGDGGERLVERADELRHESILSRSYWWDGGCAKWAAIRCTAHALNRGRNWRTNARGQSPDTLKDKLAAGRFVVTAEITPPVSFDAADLLAKAMPLKGLADAVNVTDGAGARAHLGAVTAAAHAAAERHRADPAVHLPRPQPHRAAERPDGGRRARHPQHADAARATIPSRATSPTPSRCSISTPSA